ncbi:MAG: cupredoxin domain-containing protein [Sporichthyaceae bacterium]
MHRPTTRSSARVAATALVAGTGLLLTSVGPASAAQQASNPTAPGYVQPAAVSNTIVFNAPTAKAAGAKMDIEKNTFLVKDLKVALGETVTWTNKDKAPHSINVTKGPEKFDSPLFKQGESWSHTFTKAGAYDYYCAVHPDMVAMVTVDEKAAKPAKKSAKSAKPAAEPGGAAMDNDRNATANSDNAHAGMGHGDAAKPSAPHQDNDKSSAAPGTSDNGAAQAAPSYPTAADPVSGAVDPFVKHFEVAHGQRTAAGQVQDIVEADSWAKSHQALVRTMVDYEIGKQSVVGTAPMVSTFMQHMDAAHFNTSPMEQASAISNFDSWNKSHLAMFRVMFDPIVGKSSVLGSSAGTGVFMQHLDAAHWNQSANEQASAIADDPAAWTTSHQGMVNQMLTSAGSGASGNTPGQ